MNRTLPNNFTVNNLLKQQQDVEEVDMRQETVVDLIYDLKKVLLQAEKELLSPRKEAIDRLLKEALN